MIDAYHQQTGDGQWLRQSLEILKGEIGMPKCFEIAERQRLVAEYHDITGRDLPDHIKRLPLPRLEEAIRQARAGVIFGEPKPRAGESLGDCSLMDFDRQDDKNGNAY